MLSEALEDLSDVVAMFSQVSGVYENVINVYYYKTMEKLPEHLIHEGQAGK